MPKICRFGNGNLLITYMYKVHIAWTAKTIFIIFDKTYY